MYVNLCFTLSRCLWSIRKSSDGCTGESARQPTHSTPKVKWLSGHKRYVPYTVSIDMSVYLYISIYVSIMLNFRKCASTLPSCIYVCMHTACIHCCALSTHVFAFVYNYMLVLIQVCARMIVWWLQDQDGCLGLTDREKMRLRFRHVCVRGVRACVHAWRACVRACVRVHTHACLRVTTEIDALRWHARFWRQKTMPLGLTWSCACLCVEKEKRRVSFSWVWMSPQILEQKWQRRQYVFWMMQLTSKEVFVCVCVCVYVCTWMCVQAKDADWS